MKPRFFLLTLLYVFLLSNIYAKTNSVPKRIISLSPAGTEILFAVGAENQIVAVSEFCDFPKEAKKIPKAGGFSGATVSMEKLLSFHPDFVYLTDGMHNQFIPELEKFKIRYFLSNAKTVSDVMQEILQIGEITGHKEQAEIQVSKIRLKCEKKETTNKKVYYEVWNSPYISAGRQSFINNVINISGGKNIFDDVQTAYPTVSEESIIARNPQIILIPASSGVTIENVKNRIGWKEIDAVKNNKIFIVDDNLFSRPGPRIGDVVEQLSNLLVN